MNILDKIRTHIPGHRIILRVGNNGLNYVTMYRTNHDCVLYAYEDGVPNSDNHITITISIDGDVVITRYERKTYRFYHGLQQSNKSRRIMNSDTGNLYNALEDNGSCIY